ncbi:MAG: hypothetical protein ACRD12_10760 [Acidimicrobiales bacterium]
METRNPPSRLWYWVGGGTAVLGLVIAVAWITSAVVGYLGRVDDFQRVSVPGEATVQFTGTGGYTVYYEAPGAAEGPLPPGRVTMSHVATGAEVKFNDYDGNFTYETPSREGRAVLTFSISEPGAYRVQTFTDGPGKGDIALGRSLAPAEFGVAIAGSVVIVIVTMAFAALVITLTAVKRHRAKQSFS